MAALEAARHTGREDLDSLSGRAGCPARQEIGREHPIQSILRITMAIREEDEIQQTDKQWYS